MQNDLAPNTPVLVSDVAVIVADVLGIDESRVAPDRSLTSLGLESFTAVRLRRQLRDETGLDLPLTAFLGSATVASLAAGHDASDADNGFPLTPLQTAYWIGRDPAFPLGGVATFYYREYDRYPSAGDPHEDVARLAAAWNRLVERHPMLRMVVGPDGRQRVLSDPPLYRIPVSDLREAAPEEADRAVEELREARSHQVRPADRWPLFDINAVLLPDGRTRLQVGIDVLTLDLAGWMQILAEWGTVFADPGAQLPEPATTFAEIIRDRGDDPAEQKQRESDRAYWQSRAEALPPGPCLPWTADLGGIRSHRFTRTECRLDAEQWGALRGRAAEHGLSPTGVLLAAFGLTLTRWGATEAFSLNTTLFDRPDDPALRDVVGDFTSTVLVAMPEAAGADRAGFLDYAERVNRRFWTDMEHRSISGVEVLRESADPSEPLTPTHPVVFTSGIGLTGPEADPAGWLGDEVYGISQTPQVALDHIVHEEAGGLRIAWDSVDGVLAAEFTAGMAHAHARLLRRLAADPGAFTNRALAWDPAFLPDEPLHCTPFGDAGPLLHDPVRRAAQESPDRAALLGSGPSVSHGEMAADAARTGAALAAEGIGPGDLVAVCLDKGPDQVKAVLGVAASGAGYVPVEPSWPPDRVTSVCNQAGITTALAAPGNVEGWPESVRVHAFPLTVDAGPGDGAAPEVQPAPEELAYVIFTSGSTGRPKGVAIEHRAARTTIDDLIDRFPVGPDDRMLALSAFSFDLSVHDIFGVMGTGAALVLPDADRQRDPGHWLELMERHGVTLWNTAPALLEMLVEYAEIDQDAARSALSRLRLVFLSADWIPVTLPDRLRALAPDAQVVSLGGATEGSIWSICFPIGEVDPAWPSIPYGRALRGQSFHVLDAKGGAPCPVGRPGELHIGGGGLARGYIEDPDQTRERFIEHPVLGRLYHTGDLGRWRHDGTIEFLGRTDRQVKIRGHRIELGEVEGALDRVTGVRQAVAMSMPGPDRRPRLVAFLITRDGAAAPDDERLITELRARVPDFMVPSRFVRLSAFPVTDNGKIDYKALENPYDRSRVRSVRPDTEPAANTARAAAAPTEDAAAPAATGTTAEALPAESPLDTLAAEALDAGLSITLRVGPGELTAGAALIAAGTWAEQAERAVGTAGLAADHRLSPDGLLELVLRRAGERSGSGDHVGAVPAVPLPVEGVPHRPPEAPGTPLAHGSVPRSPALSARGRDPEVERVITTVLAELLECEIDTGTRFFQLGATSLTLVLAHRRLVEELDPELSVVELFTHPTVVQLAEYITERRMPVSLPPGRGPESPSAAPDTPAVSTTDRAAARRRARATATEAAG